VMRRWGFERQDAGWWLGMRRFVKMEGFMQNWRLLSRWKDAELGIVGIKYHV